MILFHDPRIKIIRIFIHFHKSTLTSPRSLNEYKVCPSNATSCKTPLCCAKNKRRNHD